MLAGTYVIPAIHVEVTGVLTNTMLTGPYRGAGRPEAAYVIETMVDLAARELGIDPAELRRRNTIPADAMPYKTALVYTYDCGDFGKNLEDCLTLADYAGFAARRAESQQRGKLRGIGISSTVEASNAGADRACRDALRSDRHADRARSAPTITARATGPRSARSSSDKLGIEPDRIRFKYGDTDQVAIGTGTFGSRSTACGRHRDAASPPTRSSPRARSIAAHLMEAGEHDIVFERRQVHRRRHRQGGRPRRGRARPPSCRRKLPKGIEPGLFETGTFDGGERTYPNGCHICEVEIDEETGAVELVRYTAVDDVGHMINPLLVEGQLHGGIAQGVGQALMENIVYDGVRPARDRLVHGLLHAARRRFLRLRARRERGADQDQSARRQGRRRVRHGRRAAVGDERGQRRAAPRSARPTCRCRRRRRRSGGRSRRRGKS